MALRAAFADRRFPPLELSELADVELEISVLTPVTPVANVEDIIPGQHGLLLTRGQHHGVLLPQVAAERNWDRYEFLDHLCLKAGLPVGSWNDGAQLYSFQSEVFHESEIK
jgi:AmmeMemoRadiSam system protein A